MTRFIIKTFLFVLAGLIFGYFLFLKVTEIKNPYITTLKDSLKRNSSTEILNLGSSVDLHSDSLDTDQSTISSRIQNKTSKIVTPISRGANNNRLHEMFVELISKENNNTHLKYIIIPINLRSYSPEWNLRPQYRFKNLSIYFDWKKLFLNDENKNSIYNYNVKFEGNYYNLKNQKKSLKNDFIYKYLYGFNDENLTLASLKNIVETKLIIKKIFYITPIDVDTGNRLIKDFSFYLNKNIDTIKSVLKNEIYLDLSHQLRSKHFSYPTYGLNKANEEIGFVNEHLNEKGREYLSDTISNYILSLERQKAKNNIKYE